jgi:hypothetical protein
MVLLPLDDDPELPDGDDAGDDPRAKPGPLQLRPLFDMQL